MGRSATNHQGIVMEIQTVWRVVTLQAWENSVYKVLATKRQLLSA